MVEDKKKSNNIYHTSLLYRLIERFTIFVTLQLLVTLILYISGNYQLFLDKTQNTLLLFCSVLSVVLLILCFSGLIICTYSFIKAKKVKYFIQFILYLVGLIISPILMFAIRVLTFVEGGI